MASNASKNDTLSLTFEDQDGILVVTPKGRIDHTTSSRFSEDVDARIHTLSGSFRGVVFDLGRLDIITSAGLRVLIIAQKTLRPKGVKVVVAAVKGVIAEVFSIAQMSSVLPVVDTVEDARSQIGPGEGN